MEESQQADDIIAKLVVRIKQATVSYIPRLGKTDGTVWPDICRVSDNNTQQYLKQQPVHIKSVVCVSTIQNKNSREGKDEYPFKVGEYQTNGVSRATRWYLQNYSAQVFSQTKSFERALDFAPSSTEIYHCLMILSFVECIELSRDAEKLSDLCTQLLGHALNTQMNDVHELAHKVLAASFWASSNNKFVLSRTLKETLRTVCVENRTVESREGKLIEKYIKEISKKAKEDVKTVESNTTDECLKNAISAINPPAELVWN